MSYFEPVQQTNKETIFTIAVLFQALRRAMHVQDPKGSTEPATTYSSSPENRRFDKQRTIERPCRKGSKRSPHPQRPLCHRRGRGLLASHSKSVWKQAAALVFFSMFASWVCAQVDSGSIQGSVTDATSAAIPNAAVTLRNEATAVSQSTHTDAQGNYTFSPVRVGVYSITVEFPGFERQERQHIRVDIQQQLAIPFTLRVGSSQQSVTVTSGVALLQTENASVGQVISDRQINDLPLNGRNYQFLAQLAAGVTFGQKDSRGEDSNGRFTVSGMRATQNNYLLDGIDNNSMITSHSNGRDAVIQTPVDALSEFKVLTNNYNAEFGRAAGAVLVATVKSGTNDLHGDVWEFLRNDALDANDYFLNHAGKARPEFHRNQYGFTLGGPVLLPHIYNGRGKTFFFGDYEGTRIAQGNAYVGTVPTMLERNSNFTNFSDLISLQNGKNKADAAGNVYPLGTVFDPSTTQPYGTSFLRTPFPGNMIPAGRIDPNAVTLLLLLPPPTTSSLLNNYVTAPTYIDNYNSFDIRIDQVIGAKDYLFARYSRNSHGQIHPSIFSGYGKGYADGGNTSSMANSTDTAQNVAVGETHTFNSRLVNDFRIGINREVAEWSSPVSNITGIPAQFGIQGVPQSPGNGGLPYFTTGDLTPFGTYGYLPHHKFGTTPQFNDDLTIVRGPHTIKVGYEEQRILYPFLEPPQSRGAFTYSGPFTSVYGQKDPTTGVAQMLLTPTSTSNLAGADTVSMSNIVEHSYIRNYLGAYVQDDWQVTHSLTLNLGVRYDFYDYMHDRLGQMANFVPGPDRVGGTYFVTSQINSVLPASFISALANEGINVQQGTLVNPQHFNFAPRIGFADVLGNRLVVRGGFGMFYGGIEDLGGSPLLGENFPVEYTVTRTSPAPGTPIANDNSLGLLENTFANLSLAPATVNPVGLPLRNAQRDMETPYAEGYNLSIEYQLRSNLAFNLAYVGSVGRHIQTIIDPNTVGELLPPGVNTTPYVPYQYTALSGNTAVPTGASSSFNGFQANLEQRLSHGLTLLANLAWQKALTDARDPLEGTIGNYRAPYLPGFGIGADKGLADFDVRRIFHLSGTYDIPYGADKTFGSSAHGIQQLLLGGWSTNFITAVQDGQPLTVGCPIATTSGLGCNADPVPGVSPYAHSSVAHFVNAAAFSNPPAVTAIGQTDLSPLGGKPTQVSGPPYRRLDISLFKRFSVTERLNTEFRAEVFNITNTANFANPTTLNFQDTASFGQITSTRDSPNDPREIQFALKLYW
jgi:hypothetical protein